MTPEEQQKTLDRLVKAVEMTFNSPGRLFWRGIVWGVARGIGATLGLGIVLGATYYFLHLSGLDETFKVLMKNLEDLTRTINSLRQ